MTNEAASLPLIASYQPRPGHADEMCDVSGDVRAHWRPLLEHLDHMGADEFQRRWEQAQRQLRAVGVTYHPQDDTGEASRPWELDAVPLVLQQHDWQQLEAALQQRARLFDRLLADLFGPQTLLRERVIPPELLFADPGFQPAYHSLPVSKLGHLILFATDLARGPDGQWWATGDRSLAPSGLGYVLENRITTSRMLPVAFREGNVMRLAPFFVTLRETLQQLASRYRDNPRIVLWSPGPRSRRYFEDAYLSRYLNYTLVEGGDLAVRKNCVMLKTLGGLLPVEVILRRVDDELCDPVELVPDSLAGVAGLLEVVRAGNIALANPLGCRLVESPAWLPFLSAISRKLLSEELLLPSVATWWCGQPEAKKYVLEHLETLLIRPAFRSGTESAVSPRDLSRKAKQELVSAINGNPHRYVAQERMLRGTAPVWTKRQLQPWHVALRSFAVASGDGFHILPGALARASATVDELENSLRAGQRSQDVWIKSDQPVEHVTLLAPIEKSITLRRSSAELPSRVADHLFWLGRNVERADGTARLLRTLFVLIGSAEAHHADVLDMLVRMLVEQGLVEPGFVVEGMQQSLPDIRTALPDILFDEGERGSLRSIINHIVQQAWVVRDRISLDAWRIVRQLEEGSAAADREDFDVSDVLEVLQDLIVELAAFAGLAGDSMTRTLSWRFLQLGRCLERACNVAALLRGTLCRPHVDDPLVYEVVLEIADSVMTYRSRYLSNLQAAPLIDLLLCDETNPRSVVFQLNAMEDHIANLPRSQRQAIRTQEERLVLSIVSSVKLADAQELAHMNDQGRRRGLDRLLARVLEQLPKLAQAVSGRFLIHAGLPRHFAQTPDG